MVERCSLATVDGVRRGLSPSPPDPPAGPGWPAPKSGSVSGPTRASHAMSACSVRLCARQGVLPMTRSSSSLMEQRELVSPNTHTRLPPPPSFQPLSFAMSGKRPADDPAGQPTPPKLQKKYVFKAVFDRQEDLLLTTSLLSSFASPVRQAYVPSSLPFLYNAAADSTCVAPDRNPSTPWRSSPPKRQRSRPNSLGWLR